MIEVTFDIDPYMNVLKVYVELSCPSAQGALALPVSTSLGHSASQASNWQMLAHSDKATMGDEGYISTRFLPFATAALEKCYRRSGLISRRLRFYTLH